VKAESYGNRDRGCKVGKKMTETTERWLQSRDREIEEAVKIDK
jgi:hypothetical protein